MSKVYLVNICAKSATEIPLLTMLPNMSQAGSCDYSPGGNSCILALRPGVGWL